MSQYEPKPEHKFTFGLWTVGNTGKDSFGDPVREQLTPVEIVHLLAEAGAYGVNFHDNNLVPIEATASERDRIVSDFKVALKETGLVVPMATTDLFTDPVFRDGAFTNSNPEIRAYALQKTMRAMDLGAELGAKVYVFWGGREGVETDVGKNPLDAMKWFRDSLNYLCEYSLDQGYGYRFALEAKPNEPRADLYLPTTGAMLGFIETLDHSEMVGVNPEVAHEHMAGLNYMHSIAQAWDAGKLFHLDLNDQNGARYDQDLRFGSQGIKQAFFLVKFLEDVGYEGSRHFDAHAYRTADLNDVRAFARGCIRTYLILKEKAEQFNEDSHIKELLVQIGESGDPMSAYLGKYSPEKAEQLKAHQFDRGALGKKGLPYEELDQLLIDLLLGQAN
ncbi:MAG: xylose isomerase [Candidatus Bipolaricaulota bacterium]|nr:xylose isomerase [Candidatus Bipolaricaulota bacterium]